MSRETTLLLECDGCGARRQGAHGETYAQLRARLYGVGWLVNDAANVDYCPTCLARGGVDLPL